MEKEAFPRNWLTINWNKLRKAVPNNLTDGHIGRYINVPLIKTYHPRFQNLSNIFKKLVYLYADEQMKVFTPVPFVSYRSGYSLRNHLVLAKVWPLLREKRSCSGKSRCEAVYNIKESDTFQGFVNKT